LRPTTLETQGFRASVDPDRWADRFPEVAPPLQQERPKGADMSDRQKRISGFAFVAGFLAGLVLSGVGTGARAATAGAPFAVAASVANSSP
jgi:hypothetical protein